MGATLTILFIALALLSPADLIPAFGEYRVQLWFAILAMLFGAMNVPRNPDSLKSPQVYLLIGMIGAVGFSRLANHFPGAGVSGMFEFLVPAMAFYLVLFNCASLGSLRTIAFAFVGIALYYSLQGILYLLTTSQASAVVMYEYLYKPEGTELIKRVCGFGFLSDPNDLAQFLLVSMALLGILWGKGSAFRGLFVFLPGSLLLTGVTLTRSRGGLLGLAALFAAALANRIGKVKAGILSAVLAVGALAFNFSGNRAISVTGGEDRLDIWRDAWGLFKGSPIWGVGYGWFTHPMFGGQRLEHTAHNSFVLCFTELGVIGFFFWVGLIVYSMAQLSAILKLEAKNDMQREIQRWAISMRIAMYTFLVTAWFLSRTYTMTFYILVGMIAALTTLMRRETNAPSLTLPGSMVFRTVAAEFGFIVLIFLTLKFRNIAL
jgi:O-antigen ligase